MKHHLGLLAVGVAVTVIATPILAQRSGGGDRPSRQCIQEIVKLCGRDRSQIPSCLQEKAGKLSESCQNEVRARAEQRRQQGANGEGNRAYQASVRPDRTILYGTHPRQQVTVFEPKDAVDDLPLVLFVHGGGWKMGNHTRVQAKPAHFRQAETYFASAGYRVLPDAPVEEQAKDVGVALQALIGQASVIGFDPTRVALMGHSAGAHLAALVATDPQYAGDAFGAIKGVVLLDGAGYDVAANMEAAQPRALNLYRDVFGEGEARQKALSPLTHVGGPDAPNWLALYVKERDIARAQADALVSALTKAGANAQAVSISNTDHGRINRELGTEAGAAQTEAVNAFLDEIFG